MSKEGKVLFFGTPEEIKIYLNNRYVGKTPLTLEYPVGTYSARAEKEGYITDIFSVTVTREFFPREYVLCLKSVMVWEKADYGLEREGPNYYGPSEYADE